MDDVVVLEAAQDMGDRIDLAHMAEKLVAEPLALGGAAHQPGDIDEFELGRDDLRPILRGGRRPSSRSSGTATRPTFGSIVQNGYFAASAAAVAVSALNRVDLPTFGNPTMPQLKPMILTQQRRQPGEPGLLSDRRSGNMRRI